MADKSIQELLATLEGVSPITSKSAQEIIANQLSIVPATSKSEQAMLNGVLGLPPTSLSFQEALYRCLKRGLFLGGTGPMSLSPQQMLQMAVDHGITLEEALGQVVGRSVLLDGVDGRITVSDYTLPSSFTVAVRLKYVAMDDVDRILDTQAGGPANGFALMASTTDKFNFKVNNDSTVTVNIVTGSLSTDNAYHVVGSFQTDEGKMFVDGVQVGVTDESCAMSAPGTTLTIGRRSGGSTNVWNGYISELMIFDRVLTAAEITQLYNRTTLPSGLSLWLPMNEGTGTTLNDRSGNGKNGVMAGGASWTTVAL